MLNVLCIGDVVGKPGRHCLAEYISDLITETNSQFTIVNIENAAHGIGITKKTLDELAQLPIDAFTLGNHSFSKKEVIKDFDSFVNIIRPVNFKETYPGKGYEVYHKFDIPIVTINAVGQVFMRPANNPFEAINNVLDSISQLNAITIVDFHAEATSEKQAMGWFLDGKISALFGTHTHVLTYDHRILPQGTGYITDIGMTGAQNTIIGMEKDPIIHQFVNDIPCHYRPPKTKNVVLNGVVFTIDENTKKTIEIKPIRKQYKLK